MTVDIIVTDYGQVRLRLETIEAYTGRKTIDEAWRYGMGYMARREAVSQLEADVLAAARLAWRQGGNLKLA